MNRRIRWFASLLLVLSVASVAHGQPEKPDGAGKKPTVAAPRLRLLVPAYFYPAGVGQPFWDALARDSARVPLVVIVNPASGPGQQADANYTRELTRLRKLGKVVLIGYVATAYGKRPQAEVQADIDRWLALYKGKLSGFFFDEQASDAALVRHYQALHDYARTQLRGAEVVGNPGTTCAREYLAAPAVTAVCLFENNTDFTTYAAPEWAAALPPERFAALAHGVAETRLSAVLGHALNHRIGHVYVTDGAGANPWDRLPTYWPKLVEAVRRVNQGGQP